MLKYYNINVPNAGYLIQHNHSFFNTVDSEDKAYILGFVLADGCVSIEPKKKNGNIYSHTKRLAFCNSIDDLEIISLIQQKLSPNVKILHFHNTKGARNRKPQISYKVNSKEIVDDLIRMGITPRKTYDINFTFNFDHVNDNLVHHFIRGFFDGDGTFNKKGKSFQLITTSLLFADQLQKMFQKILPHISSSIRTTQGKNMKYYTLILNCGRNKYIDLFNYLYDDATIFLSRKHEKFVSANTEITSRITKGLEVS